MSDMQFVEFGSATFWSLLLLSVKGLLLAVGVWSVLRLSRIDTPRLRHSCWITALLGMLLLAPLGLVSPWFEIPVQSAAVRAEVWSERQAPGLSSTAPESGELAVAGTQAPGPSMDVDSEKSSESRGVSGPGWRWKSLLAALPALLGYLYWAGAALALSRLVWVLKTRRQILQDSEVIGDASSRQLLKEVALAADLEAPALRVSSRVRVPLVTGILRPRILLPSHWQSWGREQLRAVLAHEMAHLKRGDTFFSVLTWLLRCLYWFHPVSHWISDQVAFTAESASDEEALRWTGLKRTEYARHLIRVARPLSEAPRVHLIGEAAMARSSNVTQRVHQILSPGDPARTLERRLVSVAVGSLILVTTGFGLQAESERVPGVESEQEPVSIEVEVSTEQRARPQPQPQPQPQPRPRPFGSERFGRNWGERQDYSPREIAELIQELSSPDALSRARAAHRLGNSRKPVERAMQPLLNLLEDGTPVEVSDSWGDGAYVTTPGREAAFTLGEFGERVVSPLTRILQSGSEVGRTNAARAFGATELVSVIDTLGDASNDRSPRVRAAVAWGLGMIEKPQAVPYLDQLIHDSDSEVRKQTAWALGMIESEQGVEALRQVIQDADVGVREQAAWALGMIEHYSGVEPLAAALADADPAVRKQAAWALGMIEHESGVAPLISALESNGTDAAARKQIAWALGMIESASAVPGLAPLLTDPDEGVRRQAAWALGMIESGTATAALSDALFDESPGVRKQVAWALGMIEDYDGTAALLEALDDPDGSVRQQVAWALGMIEDSRALDRLEAVADSDHDSSVRKQARWAIHMIRR